MAHDLTVNLANEPGTLARLGEVLGNAGINIEGVVGKAEGGEAHVHILVNDAGMARETLSSAGIECGGEREVEVISIVDQPGEMGRHLRRVADAGVNVDLVYLASGTRLVLGSTDAEGLRAALHSS
jgi:hypothetical protein